MQADTNLAAGVAGRGRALAADLWSDGRGPLLVAVSVAQLLRFGTRVVFPALLPQIKVEYALDNTTAGIVLGALAAAAATTQFPGGVLADRVGERKVLTASMGFAAAGLVLVVAAPVFPGFVAGLVLFGLGTGLFGTTRVTVLSDVYPLRGGTVLGLTNAAGNVGNAGLPIIAGALAAWLGWRAGVAVVIPLFALTATVLWVVVPNRTSAALATGRGEGALRQVASRVVAGLSRPSVLFATGGMIAMTVVYQGFISFFPTYLVSVKDLPVPFAATLLGVFFAGGVILQPIIGGVADRYGAGRTLVVVTAGTATTLVALPFVEGPIALGLLAAAASLQLGFWPVVFAYDVRALPGDIQGTGLGLQRTTFLYAGVVGPVLVGSLADAGLFDEAYFVLAGMALVGLALSARLPRLPG